ncbi:HdeD family acid-resistance protein [Actinoplanes sp. CA-142083]|uniref:HdeD family acid-resistance protein n=1 Tax=Actinoplanes sp. CA-142083 TaxID=3239903 RepID=UPI003D909004
MFEGRMLLPERSKYWWVELLAGFGWLVIAWLVLRANVTSLATVGLLLGVLFIVAGLNEIFVATMVGGGWKVLHYVIAVIFLLGGLWALIRPVNTFFALVSVLGLVLLLEGAFEIVRGVSSRAENPYWWLGLVTGVLLILLALWVSGSDRVFNLQTRAFLVLFWVGLMALIRAVSAIILAFAIRRADRTLTPA